MKAGSSPYAHILVPTAIAAIVLLGATPPASAADVARGAALYELNCAGCHTESVHGRKTRVATNFDEVRGWVNRWSGTLRLRWSEDELDDVSVHLNNTYYRYPCPPRVCKVVSLARNFPGIVGNASFKEHYEVLGRAPRPMRANIVSSSR